MLMGHILHDWDLPTKRMLIQKAYDAIPVGGALVVYESIIDDDRSQNAFGLMTVQGRSSSDVDDLMTRVEELEVHPAPDGHAEEVRRLRHALEEASDVADVLEEKLDEAKTSTQAAVPSKPSD